jgi:hypothetical protein
MFRNTLYLVIISFTISIFSCSESETRNGIEHLKAISKRVTDLGKTIAEVKIMESNSVLIVEEKNRLEYEFPIRDNEYYDVVYRFKDSSCVKIKMTTHFNNSLDAEKVQRIVIKELNADTTFKRISQQAYYYQWIQNSGFTEVELRTENSSTGRVELTIKKR